MLLRIDKHKSGLLLRRQKVGTASGTNNIKDLTKNESVSLSSICRFHVAFPPLTQLIDVIVLIHLVHPISTRESRGRRHIESFLQSVPLLRFLNPPANAIKSEFLVGQNTEQTIAHLSLLLDSETRLGKLSVEDEKNSGWFARHISIGIR